MRLSPATWSAVFESEGFRRVDQCKRIKTPKAPKNRSFRITDVDADHKRLEDPDPCQCDLPKCVDTHACNHLVKLKPHGSLKPSGLEASERGEPKQDLVDVCATPHPCGEVPEHLVSFGAGGAGRQ